MNNGALVGAYERDNFGDILFLDATRHWLPEGQARAFAPFPGDTTAVGGEQIQSYAPQFATEDFDYVWVVGGEVGATSVDDARRMSAHAAASDKHSLPPYASPYMPRPSRYAGTINSKYVLNSVGLSGVSNLSGRRKIETTATLREATFISVREDASAKALEKLGIAHAVAPDIVHTIQDYIELTPDQSSEDVALIQLKKKHIHRLGINCIAQALCTAKALKSYRIRFFSAGEASGHDSTAVLTTLADECNRHETGRFSVSTAQTAAEKANEIRNCGLWIGTSLHGYILSSTFAVPRVGLMLKKLDVYSRTWNIPQPTAVDIQDIDTAVSRALTVTPREHEACAERLISLSRANAEAAAYSIGHGAQPSARLASREDTARQLARMRGLPEFLDRAKKRLSRRTQ